MSKTMKTDGGPAFPGGSLKFDEGDCTTPYQIGMSLRDWFAGQALAGFMANTNRPTTIARDDAHWCYEIADAMLVARAEGKS